MVSSLTAARSLSPQMRARGVTAVLGPTNTGKTHLAIERMVGHTSGVIGLPLRLLAREVYGRVVERVGADAVALITGEEKIKPPNARYWVATVEAMPSDLDVAFCAIDEIQLAADLDRGHIFTDRLLNRRGYAETLIIGAATMRPLVETLIPGANIVSRPRLSTLTFTGEKKITRLPPRSAIVAFSAEEVYTIAELVKRQKGGAAVVLGALSPRTRNAQVALYQSGEVDYLIATDAIGMGLNLEVNHVAFAGDRKFDGFGFRQLNPAEFGQIAGRAGRHMRDGTFGTTGRCPPFDAELVEALESHSFDPVRVAQWRNADLNFRSLGTLQASLAVLPTEKGLTRAPLADDVNALDIASRDDDIRRLATGEQAVSQLWEVCRIPDYRRVAPAAHADLIVTIYRALMTQGVIADDWFRRQVALVDRTDGDIDTLSARIAQVRTWTFVANRPDWLRDPEHWQEATRQVEDKLSDALHERLASRFVDRRTSVLMRRLRENAMLEAEVTASGDVLVEGQHVGRLHGFQFAPDPQADGQEAKALRAAAQKALAGEIEARAERFSQAPDDTFVLANDGTIRWMGEAVAKLVPGDKLLTPRFRLLADEQLSGPPRDKVDTRLQTWIKAHITKLLGPLIVLEEAADIPGIARGIAFQITEALGVLERARVAQDVKGLDQDGRAALRRYGVRFGAYHLYLPLLLKPAPRGLAAQLWALKHGGLDVKGLDEIPHLAASGRTSFPADTEVPRGLYRAAGFRVCGGRAVRIDILERLADLIRPAIGYRPGTTPGEPPAGTADGDGFVVTVGMTSLAGCSGEDFSSILKSLGYVVDRRAGPAITVPLVPAPQLVRPAADAAAGAETASDAAAPAEAVDADNGEATASVDETELAADMADAASIAEASDSPSDAVAAPLAAEADEQPAAESIVDAPAEAEPVLAPDTVAEAEVVAEIAPGAAPADVTAAVPVPTGDVLAAEDAPASAEGEPAQTEQPADAEPAGPEMIEVWRPHRQNHHAQSRRRNDRTQGEGRPDRRAGDRNQGQGRRAPQGEAGTAVAQDGQPREGQPQRQQRDNAAGDRPKRDWKAKAPNREGGREPGKGDFGKGGGGKRGGGSFGKDGGRPDSSGGHRGGRSGNWQDRPQPRADKAPDPNSPFAKLLALKEELEARAGRKG
ncbi:ATP-dependent RNA helicase SUPV3L1/SUV3 [Hyphomicrobiales bacterium]|nr:ATP-dependent RNA helicase SUPV3L1/SUV3 [Hyphomicrobiales bacterium]CAH1680921.1 ATP-dependent RNA helicase SUPV3L1/SUV3 [Hyphomicrobiales bacterium]